MLNSEKCMRTFWIFKSHKKFLMDLRGIPNANLHPSIHFLYPPNPIQICGALEPIPAAIGREVEYNWTGHQSITGPIKDMKTLKQKKNI